MTDSDSQAQAFKVRDAASYDPVAPDFDHYSSRLSLPLALRMISLAKLEPSDRVLDVGTGTGIVALRAAQEGGHKGRVLGVDLSEGMLATATAKAARAGLAGRVEFRQMDAEALQLADGSFDVALSLFALLHFPNPLTALTEMFRVLRPGGRLVVAVGSRPPLVSLNGLIHRFSRLPDIWQAARGRLMTAPAALDSLVKRYIPESSEPEESHLAGGSLNRTRGVVALVQKAGFAHPRTDWVGANLVVDSPEEFWAVQRTFSSVARKRLDQAPPETVESLREEFLKLCRGAQERGGRLIYPVAAFYVAARRPEPRS